MGSVMTARLIVCYYLTKYLDGVPPGLNVCFQVDVAESGDEELVQYLDSNYLHIDVWDGDSLMYLGSSQLQLRSALRQGAAGVAYEDDIPIAIGQVSEEYRDKMTTSVSHSSGLNIAAMSTPMSPPAVCGTLHVRVVNTGGESKKTGENTKGSQSKECILNDYHHNLNNKPVTISYPKRMPEVDSELFDMLSKTYQERMLERKHEMAEKSPVGNEKQRKLDRIRRIKEKENLKLHGTITVLELI